MKIRVANFAKLLAGIVVVALAIWGIHELGDVPTERPVSLTLAQLENLDYGYPGQPLVFADGQHAFANVGTSGQTSSASKTLERIDEKLVAYGDLNGDGVPDAVVPVYSEPVTNDVPDDSLRTEKNFYVVMNDGGNPAPIPVSADVAYDTGSCGLYDGLIFQSLAVSNGKVVVNVLSKQTCSDQSAVAKKVTYEIKGGKIVLVSGN